MPRSTFLALCLLVDAFDATPSVPWWASHTPVPGAWSGTGWSTAIRSDCATRVLTRARAPNIQKSSASTVHRMPGFLLKLLHGDIEFRLPHLPLAPTAQEDLKSALSMATMELALSGQLGTRTHWQTDKKAQLVVHVYTTKAPPPSSSSSSSVSASPSEPVAPAQLPEPNAPQPKDYAAAAAAAAVVPPAAQSVASASGPAPPARAFVSTAPALGAGGCLVPREAEDREPDILRRPNLEPEQNAGSTAEEKGPGQRGRPLAKAVDWCGGTRRALYGPRGKSIWEGLYSVQLAQALIRAAFTR